MKTKQITGVIVEKSQALTLEEFCFATKTNKEFVIELVEYQLIDPIGSTPKQWRFDSVSLRKARIAGSFYHDLEVNMAGIALALDLLDKIEEFQQQLKVLKNNLHE